MTVSITRESSTEEIALPHLFYFQSVVNTSSIAEREERNSLSRSPESKILKLKELLNNMEDKEAS